MKTEKGAWIIAGSITVFMVLCGLISQHQGMTKALSFLIPMWGVFLLMEIGKVFKKSRND